MRFSIEQLPSSDFPQLLSEIPDPPKELWIRGTLPSAELTHIAVVGSRKYSSYGKQVVEHIISGLRDAPVVIVSGLALGIDSLAHKAALEAGLPTIAVPGSGLADDALYPRSNTSLARAILESGGALLSEFNPEERAAPWMFPKRNRIMAGMCHATLLIEATEKSGTLITAKLAADYNRELLAVPGSIFSESSKGVHQFIKLGATPVTSAEDVLHALGIKNDDTVRDTATLSENEQRVLKLIAAPLARDELIRALEIPTTEAQVLLSSMEIKGLLKEELGVVRNAL